MLSFSIIQFLSGFLMGASIVVLCLVIWQRYKWIILSPSNHRVRTKDQETLQQAIFDGHKVVIKNLRDNVYQNSDDFEVRRYQRLAVVECEYEKRPEGYELLGGYCAGETAAGLPMPKTAPCVMRPTASPKTMWYILPNPHTPLDPADAPVPPPVRRAL